MDKFEQFIASILNKDDLNPTEYDCLDDFNNYIIRHSRKSPPNTLQYSINLYDVCCDVYNYYVNYKKQIASLVFSDGNKIYIEKYKLRHVPFFNNYFNDCDTSNDVIIELPMGNIIDDYEIMSYVIDFIYDGDIVISIYDYEKIYKLIRVNDYLLGVMYRYKYVYPGQPKTYIFKNVLQNIVSNLIKNLNEECNIFFEYKDGCFNMIYDMCCMLDMNIKIYVKDTGIFHKYKEEFEKSLLVSYVTY